MEIANLHVKLSNMQMETINAATEITRLKNVLVKLEEKNKMEEKRIHELEQKLQQGNVERKKQACRYSNQNCK